MSDDGTTPQTSALARQIAVRLRQNDAAAVRERTRLGLTQRGTLRLGDTSAHDGVLPGPSGGTGHEGGAEPPLGNPATTGQALTSTAGGARSWLDVATQAELDAGLATKANLAHEHAAADLTSGVLAPARLGSGTASATTVLYGDGTFKAAPSGGGGGAALTIEEAAGTPTVAATKLVLPNGTLAVAGTVATYTPTAGGGAGFTNPMTAAGDLIVGAPATQANVLLASLGVTATQSAADGGRGAVQLIDGNDPASGYVAGGVAATDWYNGGGAGPHFARFNFGGTQYAINGLRIIQHPNGNFRAGDMVVQSSPDGATWTTRFGPSGAQDTGLITLPAPLAAPYWRIYSPTAGQWAIEICELYSGLPAGQATRLAQGAASTVFGVDASGVLGYRPDPVGQPGPTGPSGVVAVSAPLTNTGTSTAAQLGIAPATAAAPGSMSAADKAKLDGIAALSTPGYMRFLGERTASAIVTKTAATQGWMQAWGDDLATLFAIPFVSGGPTDRFLANLYLRAYLAGDFFLGLDFVGPGYAAGSGGITAIGGANNPTVKDMPAFGSKSFTGLAAGNWEIRAMVFIFPTGDLQLRYDRYFQLFRIA